MAIHFDARRPLLPLWPLLLATFAVGTDAWVVAGFLPEMARELDTSEAAAGQAVTVFAISYVIGAPLLAAWTSRWPRRELLSAALLALAVFNFSGAIAPSLGLLLVARAAAALAAAVITPTTGVLAAASAPATHLGRALALVISGLTLATAIGVPVGTVLSAVAGWRVVVGGVGTLSLGAAVAVCALGPDAPGRTGMSVRQRFAPLARQEIATTLALTTLGMAAAYCAYAYIGPFTHANGPSLTAVLLGYGIGAVAGSLTSGSLADRFVPARGLGFAYLLIAAAVVVCAAHPGIVVTVIAGTVWGAAAWSQTPFQQQRLLAYDPEHAATTIGLNAAAIYLGIAIGTALGGVLIVSGGWYVAAASALFATGAAALNAALARSHAVRRRLVSPVTSCRMGTDELSATQE